jgi:hypothetical protein
MSFTCIPRLPKGWNEMALNHIEAFGSKFSLNIKSVGQESVELSILKEGKVIYSKTDLRGSEFNIDLQQL